MAVDANKLFQTISEVAEAIKSGSLFVVGFGMLVILAVVVLKAFGVPTFWLPTMGHEQYLYYSLGYAAICWVFK